MKTRRHLVHGLQGKVVKPRFERQFLRTIMVAESSGDDFVHDLGGGEAVLGNLLVGAAEIEFAVHETFQPRKIGIHIGADVIGGNRGRQHRCQRLLERNAGLAAIPAALRASAAICGWSAAVPYAARSAGSVRQRPP